MIYGNAHSEHNSNLCCTVITLYNWNGWQHADMYEWVLCFRQDEDKYSCIMSYNLGLWQTLLFFFTILRIKAACFFDKASETNDVCFTTRQDDQLWDSKKSQTAIHGWYAYLKRSAMGWACSQNEAQAPTETAPLLAAEDEQVNQSKPRLWIENVVKINRKWRDIKRLVRQSKALDCQTWRTIIQSKI